MQNINIGLFGHVDSGKTTISKVLSLKRSTAAFDSSPQSSARGITLDLGFSSFPTILKGGEPVQITLVDCPGHSSLIKTVMGSIQIIDGVILVLDASKGIQFQTAECIALCEILSVTKGKSLNGNKNFKIIVALNKIDTISEKNRENRLKRLKKVLNEKVFCKIGLPIVPIVPVMALDPVKGILALKEAIDENISPPKRVVNKEFLMSFEHCFDIKGKGTVFTGTVLEGAVSVGDEVSVMRKKNFMLKKKVKSIEMFSLSVKKAVQGDRIGVLFTRLEGEKLERGFLYKGKDAVQPVKTLVVPVTKVKQYKKDWPEKRKISVTIGYNTAIVSMQ